jgi:general stress protein 26
MVRDANDPATARDKLWELIKDIEVAMMTSWDGKEMHSRPMHSHHDRDAGRLLFFTRLHSGKSDEIARFDKLSLAYADVGSNTYVSIAGRGTISRDRDRMRAFWSPAVSAWFPGGLDDPELALIEVTPESAQYWDATSSSMRYLWEMAAANLTGREPDVGESRKLDLQRGA